MLGEKAHRIIFLFLVYSLVFFIMFGKALASFPIILLGANWLLEGDFKRKWQAYKTNRLFWVLISLFIMPVLGFAYSADMDWAMNLFRVNLPLFVLPLVFYSAKPLSDKELQNSFRFFITSCVITSLWCLYFSFVLHSDSDIRDASRFMSHIRFGLFINMAIAASAWLAFNAANLKTRVIYITVVFYFIMVLLLLGMASGLVNLFLLFLFGIYLFPGKHYKGIKMAFFVLMAVATIWSFFFVKAALNKQSEVNKTEYNTPHKTNAGGRPLIHFDTIRQKENGNFVLMNLQLEDLRKTWNRRVPNDTFSYQPEHNLKRYEVLVRYLASKAVTKDEVGVNSLTQQDLDNIKNGMVNYQYANWSHLRKRLYELINEAVDYKNNGGVNGHSLTMRLYYWQAATKVIASHPIIGVGTGDAQMELNETYKNEFPDLNTAWYKHPHNQYLSIAVCFGFLGLALFMFVVFYPFFILRNYLHPLYKVFMMLLLVSFITEDTLESQAGIGFYAIFNTLFCSVAWYKRQLEIKTPQIPEG